LNHGGTETRRATEEILNLQFAAIVQTQRSPTSRSFKHPSVALRVSVPPWFKAYLSS